ncbi:NADH:ubiquinone oxidoreductase [Malassezia vespertilionis]|uniref:Nde1p n=1 Tax=Malassezia vespertilionis TaxID=2020962 RepID=A0A2N1JA97_9BASI|nr:NADH:ubiquinone oxidoreductase [Malassezia vespertilionis]PKI83453.1 Nde1p [Malassezia vespertilionis]WFD07320.1 NADH:ubiquinone oxidoreductase [Malassezia vespertilionis]
MGSPQRDFRDAGDEARHWKAQVRQMQEALHDAEAGLQEFMESSKELETELEADIAQSTKRAENLRAENESLRCDVDEWRSKYQKSITEHNSTLADMHRELAMLRESHNAYKSKLRDMELDNDELENAERMINTTLVDMEIRYNQAVERTAELESELQTKARLEEENQRLKDLVRDMQEEMDVLKDRTQTLHPHVHTEALTLGDLVVHRAPRRGVAKGGTLDRLREHMQQLQLRLQTAQSAPFASRAERSALPRPRSSLSASTNGAASPWRSTTPMGHAPMRPERPETPSALTRDERRKSNSFIPVPATGLARSQSRTRTSSRLSIAPETSPSAGMPYGFMGTDPAMSPVAATRRANLARRRSMGPTGVSKAALPSVRAPSPSKLRASPTKPGQVPWR